MGALNLPDFGIVYVDTPILIYSIEKIAPYFDLLVPLWKASETGKLEIMTSELTVVEILTGPMKKGNNHLISVYDELINGTEIQLIPVDRAILRGAAKLRAQTSLKTPDAIHAATAMAMDCSAFVTNDISFRTLPFLPVQILKDIVK